jgi:hypothetical protein
MSTFACNGRSTLCATSGFRLPELADLLTDVLNHDSVGEYAESQFYNLLGPNEDALERAFRAKAAAAPTDFGLRSSLGRARFRPRAI